MTLLQDRQRLTVLLLVLVIAIMIVQNFFLVRKISEYRNHVAALREKINHLTVMNPGDSLSTFTALGADSSLVQIDLGSGHESVLLLIFTTWCHACLENMPRWITLVDELSSDDTEILGICPDPPHKIREYSSRMALSFPVYSVANDSSLLVKYKLQWYPQTIFVDSSGVVLNVWSGVLTEDQTRQIISGVKMKRSLNERSAPTRSGTLTSPTSAAPTN